jgi:rhamnulose-1-phosphate aldolase/alcohol dehydrogenase
MPKNLWNNAHAKHLKGMAELVYRSNLIGSDRSVCNWGGGNTSMKTIEKDFRGRDVPVMWVKGSGSDLATMQAKHFTALRLEDVHPLIEREKMCDEEMVAYLTQCMTDAKHPRMSIETLLHAFLPYPHVDHTHPDAAISICCADNGREIARKIFGDRFVWVPYVRPGFTLSKMIAEAVRGNPKCELVLMEKHGLVTWGRTSAECYQKTLAIIQEAEDFIARRASEVGAGIFGGQKHESLSEAARRATAARVMPVIRGALKRQKSAGKGAILSFDDGADILRFVNSGAAPTLSQVGAACPDHLVHTKMTPLYIDWNPASGDLAGLCAALEKGVACFVEEYQAYFARNQNPGDKIGETAPRVILIPGVGMITTGKSKANAGVSAALYRRAISVMAGATVLGNFVSLSENESFNVEYWPLELYKLTLAPPEAEFSRQVALITGGAGGIGGSAARRLVKDGAHVVLADLNVESARKLADEINAGAGEGRALAVGMDVTKEEAVIEAFNAAALQYGGVDILVNNAGLATSSPFAETTVKEWNLNMDVLATGYFIVGREAFKMMKTLGGGAMVFVGSKNSLCAGKNAAAYSAAKAAEIHLARCIAAEGGEHGIRVNSVLPDAVLQGSAIWNSSWRSARAAAYGIKPEELEEYYRKRTTLLVNVYPEDIAEAIAYFASSKSSKTTGCMLTVDGGVTAAFTR